VTDLDEKQFKRLLAQKGLKLDDKGFDAALQGAQNLKAEVARVATYLASQADKKS
jgi:hypothetical protein